MGTNRENTVVVDLSILPKRPEPSIVEKFMYGELKLDMEEVRNIQFHNVRNVVYVEMVDAPTALRYHNAHHLRRVLTIDKQDYKIPVYVDDAAVNVRVHDLPPQMDNSVLKEHLAQFGTILSISRERWKNYFPGVYNGVRVVRMDLTKPIPSYQTIGGETTLITYRNQPKTCRFCGLKLHPRQKCGTSNNNPTASEEINNTDSTQFTSKDFPPLGDASQQKVQKQQKQQQEQSTVDRCTKQAKSSGNNSNVDAPDSDSDTGECLANNKRRLSTKRKGNEMKRKTQGNQEHDDNDAEKEAKSDNESTSTDVLPASPAVTRSANMKKKQNLKII